jgi:hypothetical protein
MNNYSIPTLIGGIVVLACVAFIFYIKLKSNKKSEENQKLASEFLSGLSDNIESTIVSIINEADIDKYNSLDELEIDILQKIYDETWNYLYVEIIKASKNDIITAAVSKLINKEYLIKFIDNTFKGNMFENVEAKWIDKFSKNNEQNDQELQNEFSGTDYNENFDEDDLEPASEEEISEEELAKLNPPREDGEEEYNSEDSSMEIVEEDDDIYIDKSGRKRSRKTGKWVKQS